MIADNNYDSNTQLSSSIPKGKTIEYIIACFKDTAQFFRQACSQTDILKPLNENKYTQIFVEQLDIQLRKKDVNISVKNQYSDIFFGTKGIPDFYFHALEEGKTSIPLFIVEAKRLPSPTAINETEYVKGQKLNGGIERFKIEKHGKGILECGLLAFIEENEFRFWLNKINEWIIGLSNTDISWTSSEIVAMSDTSEHYSYLTSVTHTVSNYNLPMHHFWVKN